MELHHPHETPGTPNGGLADSVHAPSNSNSSNSYPSREQAVVTPTPDEYDDEDAAFMMPRDVTNVPWHARNDSVPQSMRSFSTLDDSVASSPVHSALLADRHEPVIRDSWPSMPFGAGRARGISQLTESSAGGSAREEFDPFRYDVNASGKPAPPPPTSWAPPASTKPPSPPVSNRYDSRDAASTGEAVGALVEPQLCLGRQRPCEFPHVRQAAQHV
ncbi:hypothetical protein PG997_008622 [Apiospora hydei]|uniref:Uncharacterized protein n=1 Tax=Apiospora hydei TaxID=1337664 RepID=A0ABR1WBC8_9PEZI